MHSILRQLIIVQLYQDLIQNLFCITTRIIPRQNTELFPCLLFSSLIIYVQFQKKVSFNKLKFDKSKFQTFQSIISNYLTMTRRSKGVSKEKVQERQTKIIDVFQIKKTNVSDSKLKTSQSLNKNFMCRIIPKNSQKQIIVKYQECKKHFPLALLDFYQNHMKLKKKSVQSKDLLNKLPEVLQQNAQQSNSESHSVTSKSETPQQKGQINKKQQLKQKNDDQQKKQNFQPLLDYDSIISNVLSSKKKLQVVFSSQERQTNPYIKQLQQLQKKVEKKPQKQRKQQEEVHNLRSRKKIKQ